MKHLEYKGYLGTIEYSQEDGVLFGKVLGIKSLLSYEGETGKDLEVDFKSVVEDYLEDCTAAGKEAERSFKGSFNVRIPSELHKKAAIRAMEEHVSLNNFVAESIRSRVSG